MWSPTLSRRDLVRPMNGVCFGLGGVHDSRTLGVTQTGLGSQGQCLVGLLLLKFATQFISWSGVPHSSGNGQSNLSEVNLGC